MKEFFEMMLLAIAFVLALISVGLLLYFWAVFVITYT